MYDCTVIFGRERAQKLWELMREASGTACPCARGGPCIFDWAHRDSFSVVTHASEAPGSERNG
ncbi:hypothetical protein GCM10009740_03430 [Terrabacter terrae]|uniref:Uncharacterized protein n=1 Tax=Terrabacter terrae TaxID=318434 RepID=A0ABN2TRP1_9MICO